MSKLGEDGVHLVINNALGLMHWQCNFFFVWHIQRQSALTFVCRVALFMCISWVNSGCWRCRWE